MTLSRKPHRIIKAALDSALTAAIGLEERVAELEDLLDEMRGERDYWKRKATPKNLNGMAPGYKLPPEKLADYRVMKRAGMTVDEAARRLGLERHS